MKTALTETIAMQQHLVEKTMSSWHSPSPEHNTAHSSPMISSQAQNSQEHSLTLAEKIERQTDSDGREESDSAVERLEIGVDGMNGIRSNTGSNKGIFMSSNPTDAAENVPEPSSSTSLSPSSPPSHPEAHPAVSSAGATAIIRDSGMCSPPAAHDQKKHSLSGESRNTIGLDRWHTWSKQNQRSGSREPADITVQGLLQYLEAVLIPLECDLGSPSSSCPHPSPLRGHQSSTSMLETYVKPVLELWQEQLQRNKQRTHHTTKDYRCNAHDQTTPFSSVTDTLALKPAVDMGSELSGLLSTRSLRQQDHVERLSQLEQAHRDTAVTISLLQDQVRHLLKERDTGRLHDRGQDHHFTVRNGRLAPVEWQRRQDNADMAQKSILNGVGKGPFEDQSPHGSSPRVDIASHLDEEQMELEKDGKPTAPLDRSAALSPTHQPRAFHGEYGYSGRSCADELVEAIAKGLEEYHSRSSQGQRPLLPHHPRPHLTQAEHCITDPHTDQYPLRPIPAAVIYGPHLDREKLLDRAITRETGLQHRDLLQPGQHDRPMRNRKRTSSMNGLGSLVKDNVKQARSCSPPRPRNSSGASLTDSLMGIRDGAGADFTGNDCRHVHAQSQPPPSSNFTPPLQTDCYDKSGARDVPESAASSIASSSALFHQGSNVDTRTQLSQYSTHQFPHHNGNGHQDHRPSYAMHSHTHSHASQTPRPTMYSEEEYPAYHHHHPYPHHARKHSYDQNTSYHQQQHGAVDAESKDVTAPLPAAPGEHHVSPYFPSAISTTTVASEYRGKHTKNYGSFSSLQSFSQHQQPHHHQYQRNDSRSLQGYDHHQHAPLEMGNFHDHQDEDVKPLHHQLHAHQPAHPHHNHHQHQHQQHHHHQRQPSSCSAPPPIYVMNRQVNTVPELWKEWTVGLGPGNPSIRQLEAQYGPSWRTSSSAANFFSRRLRIINEIQRMIDFEGLSEEEAVNRLEARREQGVVIPGTDGSDASSNGAGGGPGQPGTGGMSLHRLSEILRKKQL